MTVREYIGARYVPLMMGDWDDTATYEPLSIVLYQGNSYTSRQYVPAGIEITNETYWACSGNYNAQVEAYREEVQTFDDRIETLEEKFPINTSDIADEAVTTAKIDDEAVTTAKIDDEAVTTAKIDDEAVTTAKIDDEAVTTAKLSTDISNSINGFTDQLAGTADSGLLDLINQYKLKPSEQATYFYIDRVDGNDNNDGLTAETAFKTVDKFLEQEVNGYTDLYCRMISAGRYDINDHRLTNMSIHFYATVPNVVLAFNFATSAILYNSYIHFEGISDGYLEVHVDNASDTYAIHADRAGIYAKYVKFTGNGAIDIAGGSNASFSDVQINTIPVGENSNLLVRSSTAALGPISFGYANPSRYLIHMQGAFVWLTGQFGSPVYSANSTGGIMRLQGTVLMCASSFSISGANIKFDNVVRMETSFMQLSGGAYDELIAHSATNAFIGTQSVINHKYAINDISGS